MRVAARRRKPGRPAAGEPSVDRLAVLESADRLIRRDGPNVSLAAIAAEAGVTKPIVYHHVGGKDAVVHGLAWRLNERYAEAARRAVAGITEPSAVIRAFVDAYFAQLETDRNLYLYVTRATVSSGVLSFADQSASGLAALLADVREAAGGERAPALPWAYGIIGMLHFVSLWWLRDADRSRAELTEQLTDLLWAGLRGEH
jgi:AcrR family transcriptional regulator